MRFRGMHYDTGVHFDPAFPSRPTFDVESVSDDMRVLAGELNCTAVRLVGDDLDRLEAAARAAHGAGLTVFFNPWPIGAPVDSLVGHFAEGARVAERLRTGGLGDLVFVAGCEVSIFAHGLVPGDSLDERIDWLVSRRGGREAGRLSVPEVQQRTRSLMRRIAAAVRAEFSGELTYASGSWEDVDWSDFDYVGVDYYRAEQTEAEYTDGLRALGRYGRPVLVLEFGCCAYEGADARGGMGWMILREGSEGGIDWSAGRPPTRSEQTQADYLREQLRIFAAAGIEGAFVFTFAAPYLPHTSDPVTDFDMASYAVVSWPFAGSADEAARPPWSRKAAFHAVEDVYRALAARA